MVRDEGALLFAMEFGVLDTPCARLVYAADNGMKVRLVMSYVLHWTGCSSVRR